MPWASDKKKKYRIALMVAIPLVALAGLYQSRDLVAEKTRGWRSANSLSKAKKSSEEGDYDEAFQLALVARQLNPESVEALRVLARAAFNSRSVRTIDYCNALFLSPGATPEDQLMVLTILQKAGDSVGFVRLYNLLPKEVRQEKPFVIVRVNFLIDRNAFDTARTLLEGEIKDDRDRQYLLLLASLLVQPSSSPEDMEKGQSIIAELADTDEPDETAQTAFELLGFIDPDRIQPELLGNLGVRAGNANKKTSAEYIAAASLAIAAARNPEDRRKIVERAIDEQGDIAPSQLAAWLERIDEGENTLAFLTEERAGKSPDLFQQRFLALIKSGNIEEAESWLQNPPASLESINVWLSRAQLARVKEEISDENNAWEQAFQVAQNTANRNEYLRIFEVAQEAQRLDLATRALLKAPTHPNGIMPPAADAVGPMLYLAVNDRLEDLKFLTEALYIREPENVTMLNNLLYLNLLKNDQVEASVTSAASVIEDNPMNLSLRTTHAMGLLILDKNQEALETLPEDPEAWKRSTDADRAIRALALERNGQDEAAQEAWTKVDLKRLNSAEKRIFFPPPTEEEKDNPRFKGRPESSTAKAPAEASAPL